MGSLSSRSSSSPSGRGLRQTVASPLGLGLFAGGTILGTVAGSAVVGVALGAVLWGAVAFWRAATGASAPSERHGRAGRTRAESRLDPFSLSEPWKLFVRDAHRSRDRFDDVIDRTTAGPLRERLEDLGRQLDRAVAENESIAQRGHDLRRARRDLDVRQTERRLSDAKAALAEAPSDDSLAEMVTSLEAQRDAAGRFDTLIDTTEQRLRVLQAQLDETVARAHELAIRQGDLGSFDRLDDEMGDVVDGIVALAQALDETDGLGPGGTGLAAPS